jgi:hypothetical protein
MLIDPYILPSSGLTPSTRRRRLIASKSSHDRYYHIRLQQALSASVWKLRPKSREPSPYKHGSHGWSHLSWPRPGIQGSYKFLNLRTGKRLTRRRWTSPSKVIDRVNQLGESRQP